MVVSWLLGCWCSFEFYVVFTFEVGVTSVTNMYKFMSCLFQRSTEFSVHLDFHKDFLIYWWLSLCSLRAPRPLLRETNWFMDHVRVHRQEQGLSTYYMIHGWARFFSGLLVYSRKFHSSHKGTFVCVWMLSVYFGGVWEGLKWETSYTATKLILLLCLSTLPPPPNLKS